MEHPHSLHRIRPQSGRGSFSCLSCQPRCLHHSLRFVVEGFRYDGLVLALIEFSGIAEVAVIKWVGQIFVMRVRWRWLPGSCRRCRAWQTIRKYLQASNCPRHRVQRRPSRRSPEPWINDDRFVPRRSDSRWGRVSDILPASLSHARPRFVFVAKSRLYCVAMLNSTPIIRTLSFG